MSDCVLIVIMCTRGGETMDATRKSTAAHVKIALRRLSTLFACTARGWASPAVLKISVIKLINLPHAHIHIYMMACIMPPI